MVIRNHESAVNRVKVKDLVIMMPTSEIIQNYLCKTYLQTNIIMDQRDGGVQDRVRSDIFVSCPHR